MKPRFLLPGFPGAASAALAAALALAGCNERLTICPAVAVLADAATRPVLKPGSAAVDPSALLYTVEVTGISQRCVLDVRQGQSESNIRISFRATRAPSGLALAQPIRIESLAWSLELASAGRVVAVIDRDGVVRSSTRPSSE